MSELTTCNYCTLQRITARAAEDGATVETLPATGDMEGWVEVRRSDRPDPVGWFLELGDHCGC
ncbi:MAG TPA: hypothetical protein VFI41_04705 [Gemmatimonadales bacterium]|nr:hypothetical protein [Gemmatimonadales bacterium]